MAIKSVTVDNLAEIAAAKSPPAAPPETGDKPVDGEPAAAAALETKEAPKNSVQARIDELTREKKELDELAQSEYEARLQAQRRVAELEARTVQPEPKVEPKPRPDRTKYEDPTKYENDLLAWHQEETLRQFREEQDRLAREEEERTATQRLEEQKEAARKKYSDFDDVISHADKTMAVPNGMRNMLSAVAAESDHGVEVLYYLAKNRDEAKRIFAMKPAAAIMALGRIEQQFMEKAPNGAELKPTTQPPVSRAPPPLPSLSSGAQGTVIADLSQPMSYKDYKRARLTEIKQRRAH